MIEISFLCPEYPHNVTSNHRTIKIAKFFFLAMSGPMIFMNASLNYSSTSQVALRKKNNTAFHISGKVKPSQIAILSAIETGCKKEYYWFKQNYTMVVSGLNLQLSSQASLPVSNQMVTVTH